MWSVLRERPKLDIGIWPHLGSDTPSLHFLHQRWHLPVCWHTVVRRPSVVAVSTFTLPLDAVKLVAGHATRPRQTSWLVIWLSQRVDQSLERPSFWIFCMFWFPHPHSCHKVESFLCTFLIEFLSKIIYVVIILWLSWKVRMNEIVVTWWWLEKGKQGSAAVPPFVLNVLDVS